MRRIEFIITAENNGRQIRDFLRDFGVSSALLTKLKQTENGITKNGEFARTIDYISENDVIAITITENGRAPERLESSEVQVCYNDEDILVLNKPPFMPVHESRNHQGDTLANVAACYLDEDMPFRAVYRLDRDTSGLVLIAKNELAASKLAGSVKKDYYAICSGLLDGSGTIDMPIKRVGDSIIKRCVSDDGERAVTHWQAVGSHNDNTLLKIKLETGRTHQIRVHFSHIGNALVGDTLYGTESPLISRQALHCKTIYFTHPITEEHITVDSPFPKDFNKLLGNIGKIC